VTARTLEHALSAFTAELRLRHGFDVAQRETHDALRAAETVGIASARRFRAALRIVYCSDPAEVRRFDAAFEAFFRGPRGIAQPGLPSSRRAAPQPAAPAPRRAAGDLEDDGAARERPAREPPGEAATRWEMLRARYSPEARPARPPRVETAGLAAMRVAAGRLVDRLSVARSRRRTAQRRGPFLDVRRTLRASVATAGEPFVLHRTGPVRRGARFVVLIDGSRSMAAHAAPVLQFAHALCRRTRRASAFAFSTSLADVTHELRDARAAGRTLRDLEDAWGGGTRIGEALRTFVERDGARLLSRETIVVIASDGLDVGALEVLGRTMRAIAAASAAVVWLNPHAAERGFTPSAGGMRTALPFVTILDALRDASDVRRIADRLATVVR